MAAGDTTVGSRPSIEEYMAAKRQLDELASLRLGVTRLVEQELNRLQAVVERFERAEELQHEQGIS